MCGSGRDGGSTNSTFAWAIVAVGIGLTLAGDLIAVRAALDQGESLLLDFVRSLDGALLTALTFGAPIATVMWLSTGITPAMMLLLLVSTGLAIVNQVLSEPIQRLLDHAAFATLPQLRRQRADLRAVADALPKSQAATAPSERASHEWSDEEFTRLTRRALSHFGNLPKLTASPLIHLPAIDARLKTARALMQSKRPRQQDVAGAFCVQFP